MFNAQPTLPNDYTDVVMNLYSHHIALLLLPYNVSNVVTCMHMYPTSSKLYK